MGKRRNYEDLGEFEMPAPFSDQVESAIEQAEQDIKEREAGRREVRVNFRWGARQVEAVKRAADIIGVPYQSYMKAAVLRQAMIDLKDSRDIREPSYGDDRTPPAPRLVPNSG